MKTIKYFLAIFALVSLISCSVEDDNPSVDQSLIVGEWNLEEYDYSGTTTLTQGSNTYSSSYIGEVYDIDAGVIFNCDNTYKTAGSYQVKLTTTAEGQTSVQTVPIGDISGSGTYRIEGNTITAEQPGQQQGDMGLSINEATIVELSSAKMVLSMNNTLFTEMEGATIEIKVEAIQVYSK